MFDTAQQVEAQLLAGEDGRCAVDDAGTPLGIPRERLDAVERWLVMQEGRPSTDKPAYDIGVVDEAVVNVVAHRDCAIGVRPSRRITDSRDRRGIEERPCPSKPCG